MDGNCAGGEAERCGHRSLRTGGRAIPMKGTGARPYGSFPTYYLLLITCCLSPVTCGERSGRRDAAPYAWGRRAHDTHEGHRCSPLRFASYLLLTTYYLLLVTCHLSLAGDVRGVETPPPTRGDGRRTMCAPTVRLLLITYYLLLITYYLSLVASSPY